jgi:hypothetical protein
MNFSVGSDVAMTMHGHIAADGTEVHAIGFVRSTSADFVFGNMGGSSQIRLTAGQVVSIKMSGSVAGILIGDHGSLTLKKILD